MLIHDARAWVRARASLPADGPVTLAAALLVEPTGFAVAAESASDNAYMDLGAVVDPERAQAQLWGVARVLTRVGVPCLVVPGDADLPDAVYPNNVYAFTPGGRAVIGHMKHPVRQGEAARADVRELLVHGLRRELVDLSGREAVTELTGVLAVDHPRRAAVCGLSSRADHESADLMTHALDLRLTLLTPLVEGEYHLNIVCAILAGRAAVLWEGGFADPDVPRELAGAWPGAVLTLTEEEKQAFAGNLLAVTPRDVLLSATAWRALRPASRTWFAEHGFTAHAVEVDELEKGGGSLRCLVAEVF